MSQRYEQRQEERDQDGAVADELHWPGKRTKVAAAMKNAPADPASNESDPRRPDIARIRSAVGKLGDGAPLPENTQADLGSKLGIDLSTVRVHENNTGAQELGAQGFTHGEHIALAPGVDVNSEGGQHILAHELVHVAQNQAAGGDAMEFAARLDIGPSDSPTEREAESGAAALTSGQSFRATGHASLPGISLFDGPTPTPKPADGKQEEFPLTDPRNPNYDPSKDPAVTSQVPPPVKTTGPVIAPPTPAPKPAPQEPAVKAPAPPAPPPPVAAAPKKPAPPATAAPAAPTKTPSPTPSLDERVKLELEKRADPTVGAAYDKVTAQVDVLRIQAVQYSFQPTGFLNTVTQSLLPWQSLQQHGREISATNPYDSGSLQAWIEGARGVIRILGDVAAWVATIADIVAAIAGLIAIITAVTVVGGAIGGAVAAIAAEIGTIAGLVKIILDLIDVIIGIVQMVLTIKKIKAAKKGSPERVKLAALLGREVKEMSSTLTGVVVQVGTIVLTAGVAAGVGSVMSKGAKGFWRNFGKELAKEFRPLLPKKVLQRAGVETSKEAIQQGVNDFARARRLANRGPIEVGPGGAGRISDNQIASGAVTVQRIERRRELIKSGKPRSKRGPRRWREVVTTDSKPVLRRKDLKVPKGDKAVKREVRFFVDPAKVRRGIPSLDRKIDVAKDVSAIPAGQTGAQVNADGKKSRDPNSFTKPTAEAPAAEPGPGTSSLTKVQMWPSQIEKLKATREGLAPANNRLMTMYDLAKGEAGKHHAGQLEKLFGGVKNNAGQMRLTAIAEQQEATQSATDNKKAADTAKGGATQQGKLGGQQDKLDASGQKLGGTKVEKPPPKEGGSWWDKAKNWLYNQTIGRIGDAVSGLQGWLTKTIGGIVMSRSGLTKEELDMAGIDNSMRADEQKDKQAEADNKQTAAETQKIDPALAEIMKGANADEQAALTAMLESQEMAIAIDDAQKALDEAISTGTAYINDVSPVIRHELETSSGGKAIDAAYVAPAVVGAEAVKVAVSSDGEGAADADAASARGELALALEFWPELNIEPGLAQIDGAKSGFVAAHGKAVADAQAAADGAITQLNALVGTTDYEGVTAIAQGLDGAVDSFLATEEKLTDDYQAALQAILDAHEELIQSAVTQEEVDLPADEEAPVQRKADGAPANDNDAGAIAARGTQGPGGALPHGDTIQKSFGKHDVGNVEAHVGGDAAGASNELGAKAYAQGNKVAFASSPDLHTAAHEAAHVVQQRSGVSLKVIDGGAGDSYERHADAVADTVVRGESAERLLDGATAKSDAPKADAAPTAPKAAAVQRKEADAPQPAGDKGAKDPKDEKKKDPTQAAIDKAAAKPKKAAGTGEPDEAAKKDVKKDAKEGNDEGKGDKAAPKADAGKDKKDAGGAADPKTAAKPADAAGGPPPTKAPAPPAPKVMQPADVVQPLPVAPVAPLRLAAPAASKQIDDQWVKETGRTTAAHHAQITADLDALTGEIQQKQNELMTLADTEATKVAQDLQGKVASFTTAIVVPGRARVEAAFGSMTKTLDVAETKAKADIAAAKVQGTTQIAGFHTGKDGEIQAKFKTAKASNDALVKKTAPAAAAVIKKFAGTIKPFVDKAKQTAVTATTTISNDPQYDPAQGDAGASGMAGGTKSLRADTYKSAILAHGKTLGAEYDAKLSGVGKDIDRKANEIVNKALEPAKQELDIALDVVAASAKKNFDAAKVTATTQLDTQEKTSLDAVAKAKAGGQQKWVAEKSMAVENADKAGKEFTDNASAAGAELSSRIKKRASEDAKNYGALAAEIQGSLKKGGPRKYEDVAPKIADAKARLASGHATNLQGLQKLATTGASELGVTLGKHQGVYQDAIKTQEGQAKIVEAAITKDVAKGATDMTGSLTGLAKGFDETVSKETAKIDGAVAQFTANAQAALADFDKKVSDQLEQIHTGLDHKLQEDLAPDKVLAKATPVADKNFKAKQKAISKDAGTIRTAMDGWGTDEEAIWGTMRTKSWGEIEFLEATYDSHYDNRGKDGLKPLRYDLQDEMSGSDLNIALSYLNHDRKTAIKLELADSTGFFNDDEKRIEAVMRGASEEEIKHLNTDPASIKVVADVKNALGGADLDVVNTLLDQNMAREDRATKANAIRLFDAMDGWGTDEATVKSKLEEADTPGERARLRAAFNAYAATKEWPQGSGVEGDDALDLALKGDMSGGELVVAQTLAKTERDEKDVKVAKLVEAADGIGTDEDAMLDALDDEEYATQWKAMKAAGDLEGLKKLEEAHKRDLDGRLAKMGEGGGIEKLIDGETFKGYFTYEELLAGKRKNGTPITEAERRQLTGNVIPEEESDGSGYLEWMVMNRKMQTGQAEPELQLAYACWGVAGTHEDLINKVLSNGGEPKPLAEVKAIAAEFKRVWKTDLITTWEIDNPQGEVADDKMKFPDPGGLLSAELGGKDWLKTRVLLCGTPNTAPQLRYVSKLQSHYAKSGLIGGVLMDAGEAIGFTEAKSTMEHSEKKFDSKYDELSKKFGAGSFSTMELAKMGEDGEQLTLLSEYLQQDVEAYNKALSSIVDTVVTVLEIVGGIIVTVVTAGTASPVLAAIIGNLIVSAGTIAFKAAAYGAQYGAGDLAKDVVQAAITAGFAGLGEVKALKTLTENAGKGATGALFKTVNDGVNKGGGRLIGTTLEMGPKGIAAIQKVVAEGTKNLIISSGQEIANTLTDEKTYDMKLGEALWGENSLGARLLKNAPKAFAEGAVKQMIDDVANVSNKDNRGGHKTAMGNMLANAMSDAGANVAGFFVYVDNYQDASTFWDQLLKSTGNKAASGFFQGYGMHKMRAKKTGRDFINGEIDAAGLLEMLSYLDPKEVRELADFVKKYGGDKVHELPDQFKTALNLPATPAAKKPTTTSVPADPQGDHDDPAELKKPDADLDAKQKQKDADAKKAADEAETRRIAAEDDIKKQEAEKARVAKEADDKRLAEDTRKQKEADEKRITEELRLKLEAEDKRKADEHRKAEEARLAKEADDKRIADEAQKKKDEDERVAKEAEKKRLDQEAEKARLAKEAEDRRIAEDARLKKEAEDKRIAEETRLKKEADDKRIAEEARLKQEADEKAKRAAAKKDGEVDQAWKEKEAAELQKKQQEMDASRTLKADQEAKKKADEIEQMRAQQDAQQGDVDQKKVAAQDAQQDKPKTGDQARADEDQAHKLKDQGAKADELATPKPKPNADTTDEQPAANDNAATGSHKGKDVFDVRPGDDKKAVKLSAAELSSALGSMASKKVAVGAVTEAGAHMDVTVDVPGGTPIKVAVVLRVSDNLAPTSAHGDDAGAARFTLDHVDGVWRATIDVQQGLHPKDIRFVIGHEVDEITALVAKHPTGKPDGGLGEQMKAGVLGGGTDKATAHDQAGAKEIVDLYNDWKRLEAEGSPDAARRKKVLERALEAQGLTDATHLETKLKLLKDSGAADGLLDDVTKASTTRKPVADVTDTPDPKAPKEKPASAELVGVAEKAFARYQGEIEPAKALLSSVVGDLGQVEGRAKEPQSAANRLQRALDNGWAKEITTVDHAIHNLWDALGTRIIVDDASPKGMQTVVARLVDAIASGKLKVLAANNLHATTDGVPYMSPADMVRIAEAANDAGHKITVNTGKPMDGGFTAVTIFVEYPSGVKGEIQIMGKQTKSVAAVEHIPYDVGLNKPLAKVDSSLEPEMRKLMDPVEAAVRDVNSDPTKKAAYEKYLAELYKHARLTEQGLPTTPPALPAGIDQHLSFEGLQQINSQLDAIKKKSKALKEQTPPTDEVGSHKGKNVYDQRTDGDTSDVPAPIKLDVTAAQKLVDQYNEWKRLAEANDPLAVTKKQALDKAIEEHGLRDPANADAKHKVLAEAKAPDGLLEELRQPVKPAAVKPGEDTSTKKPATENEAETSTGDATTKPSVIKPPTNEKDVKNAEQLSDSVEGLRKTFGEEIAKKDTKLTPPPSDRPVLQQGAGDALIGLPIGVISPTADSQTAINQLKKEGIPRWGALTDKERKHETAFASVLETHLDAMVGEFYKRSRDDAMNAHVFEVDGAKKLYAAYGGGKAPSNPAELDVRATANHALHPAAVAIARLAFLKHLDHLKTLDPSDPQRSVLVTNGGCAAGKGSLTGIVKDADGGKFKFGAVWDAAGEGDSGENGWILQAAQARGLKVTYGFVESDPTVTYNGVLDRAESTGRIVDPVTFTRSYVKGQENMKAFLESPEYKAAAARGEVDAVGVYTGKFDMETKSFPQKRLLGDQGRIGGDDIGAAPDETKISARSVEIFEEWLKKQQAAGKPIDHWVEGGIVNPLKFDPKAGAASDGTGTANRPQVDPAPAVDTTKKPAGGEVATPNADQE